MATYKVQSNGKAPSGLKAGDTVVTGGGTYKITGTNSDGSYKSTKVSNTTTSSYTGSYASSSSGSSSKSTSSNSSKSSLSSSSKKSSSSSSSTKNNQYTQGNYTIGSDYGKQQAQNLGVGASWTATDGSKWVKENDGTITVYHNGTKTTNAWIPTKTSTGGSSGGSTSSGNSQYISPSLGNTWNANTDYQAIINNAVANGDYVTAAKAEQLRNQKITATGSPYNTTNIYAGYLQPDFGIQGQNAMANNASAQEVRDIYNNRYDKAINTPGLEQYANDAIQQQMLDYILKKEAEENQQKAQNESNQWIEDYEQDNPKEEFESKYDPQIDAILNEILNRDDFSYDAMNDPLYQQYAKMYQREGDRAMRETLAEAAAGAGGMNTYAITAAQQANSYYNSQLNDRIPELYQLAYDMYLNDKESKVQDLGILQNMDTTQYNRYRDTINDYYADKNFAYNAYQNAVQQGNWQTNFDYNAMLGNRNWNNDAYWKNKEWNYNDMWANKEWNSQQEDKEYNRNQTEIESAKAEIQWYIENGVTTIPSDLIKKAGLDQNAINQMIVYYQNQQASKGTSSSSSKKKSYDYEDYYNPIDDETVVGGNENYAKVANACEEMASKGDKWGAAACAKEALDKGFITQEEYNSLLAKYNPMLDITPGGIISPENAFKLK